MDYFITSLLSLFEKHSYDLGETSVEWIWEGWSVKKIAETGEKTARWNSKASNVTDFTGEDWIFGEVNVFVVEPNGDRFGASVSFFLSRLSLTKIVIIFLVFTWPKREIP